MPETNERLATLARDVKDLKDQHGRMNIRLDEISDHLQRQDDHLQRQDTTAQRTAASVSTIETALIGDIRDTSKRGLIVTVSAMRMDMARVSRASWIMFSAGCVAIATALATVAAYAAFHMRP
jgi:hypothetical protein